MTAPRQSGGTGIGFPSVDVTSTGRHRIGALTGIRWWAAFGVLLSHNIPGGQTPRIVQSFFEQGNLGVTVFFVLSGFILTYTYAGSLARPSGARIWSFYVARFARVYPLYLLVLLWVTPRKIVTYGAPMDESWLGHLFGVQAWFGLPIAWSWNGPAWSVSVEFFFYALFPLIIFLARPLMTSERRAWVFTSVALAAVVLESALAEPIGWTSDGTATVFPVLRLCDFVLGMAVGAVFLCSRSSRRLTQWGLALLALWLAWTVFVIWLRTFYYGMPGFNIAYAIPSAALILGLAWTPELPTTRWLATRPMIVLGEASYAFYLVHMSVGADLTLGLLSDGFGKKNTFLWIIGVVFLTAMAIGLNTMVETPARRLVRKWLVPDQKSASARTPPRSIERNGRASPEESEPALGSSPASDGAAQRAYSVSDKGREHRLRALIPCRGSRCFRMLSGP